MANENTTYVYLHTQYGFEPVGILTMQQANRDSISTFAYGRRYLEKSHAVAIDPVQLPLLPDAFHTKGVFRAFQDASPDAWGRHLLDRAAEEHGLIPTEFDYLTAQNQSLRIGAMRFGADLMGPSMARPSWRPPVIAGEHLNLEQMLASVDAILDNEEFAPHYHRFLDRGSSVGGAQPKALTDYNGRNCIAKFSQALEAWPTCRTELAAMRLAARCGITVPYCEVVNVGGRDVFLIERFDRQGQKPRHFLSAMTLIGSDTMTQGSYSDIAMVIRKYSNPNAIQNELEELFRRMVFNVLVNNYDDHLRNHGFLYDTVSQFWSLSPAYDIVPQPLRDESSISTLTLTVGKYGKQASLDNALSEYSIYGLTRDKAKCIVQDMVSIVREHWKEENYTAGVSYDKLQSVRVAYRAALNKVP
ncbi:MAG: type II toxin-antitoxin system HipA family toxin [Pseudomonadota bacterium]